MNFVTGKQIPRRAFVKGVGASMALPFLDAMIPAGRVWSKALPEADPTRVIAIEMVHGLSLIHISEPRDQRGSRVAACG